MKKIIINQKIIGLPKNKCEEDEKSTHSADFSGNELKEKSESKYS